MSREAETEAAKRLAFEYELLRVHLTHAVSRKGNVSSSFHETGKGGHFFFFIVSSRFFFFFFFFKSVPPRSKNIELAKSHWTKPTPYNPKQQRGSSRPLSASYAADISKLGFWLYFLRKPCSRLRCSTAQTSLLWPTQYVPFSALGTGANTRFSNNHLHLVNNLLLNESKT